MRVQKFIPCDKCKDTRSPGYKFSKDEDGNEKVSRCDCWKKYQQTILLQHKLINANIPIKTMKYDINSYVGSDVHNNLKAIRNYINKFDKYNGWHLYFYGTYGTQKSTLLRYIGKELLLRKKTVYYVLADELIKELIRADREEDIRDKWTNILQYDLLIIDEMSEDKITTYQSGWQRKFILPFLKKRLELYNKNVIFASNSPYDNIGTFFEGAIQDLIRREVKAQLTFEDNYEEESKAFDASSLWED